MLFQFVIIDINKVGDFSHVRSCVQKQVNGSFLHGDINAVLWKRYMLITMEDFVNGFFKLKRPVRNIGYQLHLLVDKDGVDLSLIHI